jgi:hypothetical protein
VAFSTISEHGVSLPVMSSFYSSSFVYHHYIALLLLSCVSFIFFFYSFFPFPFAKLSYANCPPSGYRSAFTTWVPPRLICRCGRHAIGVARRSYAAYRLPNQTQMHRVSGVLNRNLQRRATFPQDRGRGACPKVRIVIPNLAAKRLPQIQTYRGPIYLHCLPPRLR